MAQTQAAKHVPTAKKTLRSVSVGMECYLGFLTDKTPVKIIVYLLNHALIYVQVLPVDFVGSRIDIFLCRFFIEVLIKEVKRHGPP